MADPYVAWLGPASHSSAWAGTSWWRRASVPSAACSIERSAKVHDLGNSEAGFSAARSQQGRQLLHRSQLRWHGRVRRMARCRARQAGARRRREGGVQGGAIRLGLASSAWHIEMFRSGAFDVVQVATHVCSQGGVRHVRIMGGGILCLKALPDLPQQGKRETKLFKQQIVLRSVRWTNGDYIDLHRESTHCGIF